MAQILVIDDEVGLLETTKDMLTALGHQVVACASGEEALDVLGQRFSFGMVITDLTMPGMSGRQVLEKIRELRPDIPVVLCTTPSLDFAKFAERVFEAGFSRILWKPYSLETLRVVVERTLPPP